MGGAEEEEEEEEEEGEEEEKEKEEDEEEEDEDEEERQGSKSRTQGRSHGRKPKNQSCHKGKLLFLNRGSYFLCYLEKRKWLELRRRRAVHRGRLLLACTQPVRESTKLDFLIEGRLTRCIGPCTAAQIKANPVLKEGVKLSDKEIERYLGDKKGFLYVIRGVKKSKAVLGAWKGNGSNATGLVCQTVLQGDNTGMKRWNEP